MKTRRNTTGLFLATALLAMALLAGLLPAPARAADGNDHSHDRVTFTEWTSNNRMPTSSGSYCLTQDVSLRRTWEVTAGTNISLCLNGHKLTVTGSNDEGVSISNGATLSLYDCDSTSPGNISGGKDCVIWAKGSFNLYSATLSKNGSEYGCVSVGSGGVFTMYGGSISGNSATGGYFGGGVYVNGGSFFMKDGSITNNSAGLGGGVGVAYGSFEMTGGSISGNRAGSTGGGVYVGTDGTGRMTGGSISGNTASLNGNDVYLPTAWSTWYQGVDGVAVVKGRDTAKLYYPLTVVGGSVDLSGDTKTYADTTWGKEGGTISCGSGCYRVYETTGGADVSLSSSNSFTMPAAAVTLLVDSNAPSASLALDGTRVEGAGNASFVGAVTLMASASDAGDAASGIAYVQYRVDSGAWASFGGDTLTASLALSAGAHTVEVRAADNAGNMSDSVSAEFVVYETSALTLAPEAGSINYDGSALDASEFYLSIGGSAGTVTWSYRAAGTSGDWTEGFPQYAGSYEVRASVARDDTNLYAAASATCEVAIAAIEHPADVTRDAEVQEGSRIDLSTKVNLQDVSTSVTYVLKSGEGTLSDSTYTAPNRAPSDKPVVTVSIAEVDVNSDGVPEYEEKSVDIHIDVTERPVHDLAITHAGSTYGDALGALGFTPPATSAGETVQGATVEYVGNTTAGAHFEKTLSLDASAVDLAAGTVAVSGEGLPNNAGSYQAVLVIETTSAVYISKTPATFTIAQRSLEGATVAVGELTYNGQVQTASDVSVKLGDTVVDSSQYTVSYNSARDAGEHSLRVTAVSNGNYTGSVGGTFTVTPAETTVKVDAITDQTYTGSQLTPAVTVRAQNGTALATTDYELVYGENVNAGTDAGSVSVKAKAGGNYTFDDATATFTIAKATPAYTAPQAVGGLVYNGSEQALVSPGSTSDGTIKYKLGADGTYSSTVPTATDAGEYTVYWKLTGDTNYSDVAERSLSVEVARAEAAVAISEDGITGTGDKRTVKLSATVEGVSGASAPTGTVTFTAKKSGSNETISIGTATLGEDGKASVEWASADHDAVYTVTASFTGNTNYRAASATLEVNTAREAQSIAIEDPGVKTYGDGEFTLALSETGSGTGAVTWTSSDENVLSVDSATGKATIKGVGETIVKAVKAADDRYNQAESEIVLTVNRLALTVTAKAASKVYGEGDPALAYTVKSELGEGDAAFAFGESAETVLAGAVARTTGEDACEYAITQGSLTLTEAGAKNYTLAFSSGTFTINKADDASFSFKDDDGNKITALEKTYGDGFTVTATGAEEGAAVTYTSSDPGVLSVEASTGAVTAHKADTAKITAHRAASTNYNAATATLDVTVKKAATPTVVWPTAGSITYGQALSESELSGGSTELGTFAWESGSQILEAGTQTASVTFTGNADTQANYETSSLTGSVSVTVNQATPAVAISEDGITGTGDTRTVRLSVTVEGVSGASAPTGTVTFTAKKSGETATAFTGTAKLSDGKASIEWDSAEHDAVYTVTATYNGDTNYTTKGKDLEINTARTPQTIEIEPVGTKTYGDAAFALKLSNKGSGTGAVTWASNNTDVVTVDASGTATIKGAGEAAITAVKAADDTYNQAEAVVEVKVDHLALTVAADAASKVYGEANPALSYTVTSSRGERDAAFASGESAETVLTGAVARTAGEDAGKYAITQGELTLTEAGAKNYTLAFVDGTFTIKQATPTVTWPTGLFIKQGAALSTVTLPSEFAWKDGTTLAGETGKRSFAAVYTPDDGNYKAVEGTVELTVDGSAPQTTIAVTSPSAIEGATDWYVGAVTVQMTAQEKGGYDSGLASLEYRVDDSDWTSVSVTDAASCTTDVKLTLARGSHIIDVRATDKVGNQADAAKTLVIYEEPTLALSPATANFAYDGSALDASEFNLSTGGSAGTVSWSWRKAGTSDNWTDGFPQYAGSYEVRASVARDDENLCAATSTACEVAISPIEHPADVVRAAEVQVEKTIDLSGKVDLQGVDATVTYALKGEGALSGSVYTAPNQVPDTKPVVTVSIPAVDANGDGTPEYTAKTVDIEIDVTSKPVYDLAVMHEDSTYGDPLGKLAFALTKALASGETVQSVTVEYLGETTAGVHFEKTLELGASAVNMAAGTVAVAGEGLPSDAGEYEVSLKIETTDSVYINHEAAKAKFTIAQRSLEGATVTVGELTYNGQVQTAVVTSVALDGADVPAGQYTVSYNSARDAGEHSLLVTAVSNGNYKGSVGGTFTVKPAATTVTVDAIAGQPYTGSQIAPAVTVHAQDGTTLATTDYTLEYGENVNVADGGSVTVKAKAGGNYTFDDVTTTFTITPNGTAPNAPSAISAPYTAKTLADVASLLPTNWEWSDEAAATDLTAVEVGTSIAGTAVYTASDAANYETVTVEVTVTRSACNHPEAMRETRNTKAATSTEDGYTGDVVCTQCGEIVSKGAPIAATGHEYEQKHDDAGGVNSSSSSSSDSGSNSSSSKATVPRTGDTTDVALPAALCMAGAAAFGIGIARKRRGQK